MYRALDVCDVEYVASLNTIPVIDGCSNKYHPSQALADILTMSEIAGGVEKIGKVAWLGIENNVSNTLAMACHTLGIALYIASPLVHENSIDEELTTIINTSSFIKRTSMEEALQNASFIHTDTWVDMEYFDTDGNVKKEFKTEFEKREELLLPYQISAQLLKAHNCNAKIMHCMPCHEGMEITRDAIDHKNSVIFYQAENRLHIEKAMLWWLFQELKKPTLSGLSEEKQKLNS
ncbi:hypothetical protein IT400_00220, partial [Candidatus Nomurabacteria bacterium]|nr:hypothetical protein [Candidatus Nomurabacteria bacterium]